jgi:hypothetical protein
MQTLPFFVLAFTCLSALAETAVPPVPLAAQDGIVPAATPKSTAAPSLCQRFRRLRRRCLRKFQRQHRRLPPQNRVRSIPGC